MNLVVVETPAHAVLWDAFVDASPNATGYHRLGWKSVIHNTYDHDCFYLAAANENGDFCGVLPLVHLSSFLFGNELVSLPFVNYGGVLCNDLDTAQFLIDGASILGRNVGATRVELRHSASVIVGLPCRQHKVSMVLDLVPDANTQWNHFNSKLRNQIRKAQKSSLRTEIGSIELLDQFYDVFARNMRDLGSPVHAKKFFSNVLEAFPDSSRIITVLHNERTIAAALVFWFRETMEIPWASSSREFNSLCPNNLLYWTAIQFAIEHGMTRFDFGRSTPHEGTYNFKLQWGTIPVQLSWQYLLSPPPSTDSLGGGSGYRAAVALWKKLPLRFTNSIGPLVRKHVSL